MSATINPNEVHGLSIGKIYHMIFRHKWTILTCLAAGLIAAAVIFFVTPTVYRSEAKLLLRYVTDTTVLDATASGGRVMSPSSGGETLINSEIEILTSRDMVEQIVGELGDDRFIPEGSPKANHALAVSAALESLSIEVPNRSTVFRLYFDAANPTLAQNFLKRLIQLYLQKHIEIHRAVGAYDFLAQQTDQIRSKLAETEDELRRIKSEAGVVSVSDDKKMLAARLEDLGKSLREAQSDMAASSAKIGILHPNLPTNLSTVVHSTNESVAVAPLLERLARLQSTETEMLMTYTEDSIPVKNVRDQIRALLEILGQDTGTRSASLSGLISTNVQFDFLTERANLASTEARIRILQEQMEQTHKEVERLDAIENKIVQLERSREIQGANYEYFAKSLEQARIDDALDSGKISNISIVQPASFPSQKIRPNLMRNMGIAAALGLVLGLGLAFLREEVFSRTLKTASQAEALLRLPVILSIPDLSKGRDRRRRAVPRDTAVPGGADVPHAASGELMNGLKEYYETLRDRLVVATSQAKRQPRVLGVTSCALGAGVTTVASGLALALAQGSKDRVLLMDLDPDHGSVHRVFGVNPSGGVVDILADGKGNKAVIERNLYLVSGTPKEPSTSLSITEQVRGMVQKMAQDEYDFVVLDMPPVSDTSIALRTAGMIDAVVLVIEANKADLEIARRARDLLLREKIKLIGIVLNKQHSYVPHWLHQMT